MGIWQRDRQRFLISLIALGQVAPQTTVAYSHDLLVALQHIASGTEPLRDIHQLRCILLCEKDLK